MTGRKFSVLLFDLGGTLMFERDPWPPIYARAESALRDALKQSGISLKPEFYRGSSSFLAFYNKRREDRTDLAEELSSVLLQGLLAEHGYPGVSDQVVAAALRAMYTVTQANWLPEEDALPTLQNLRGQGYRLGYVSNAADDENTQFVIDKGGLRPYAEFIISSAACGMRKPHPLIFQQALDHFQVPPGEAAMIGDALEADILGANRLGIFSIWISRRARPTPDDLAAIRPGAHVTALQELPGLLNRLS